MAKTTAEQLKKIIKKIKTRYMVDTNEDGYSIWLVHDELKLVVNDDDTVTVSLLDESCTTKAPFDIIKSIVTTRWSPNNYDYTRSIGWTYNNCENLGERERDSRVALDAIEGFNDCIPIHFEDSFGSLDIKNWDKIESYITGEQIFEYRVHFICEPSKKQLEYINKQFDDTVLDELRKFFQERGIDASIRDKEYFSTR